VVWEVLAPDGGLVPKYRDFALGELYEDDAPLECPLLTCEGDGIPDPEFTVDPACPALEAERD